MFSYVRKRLSTIEASVLAGIGLFGAALWLFLSFAGAVVEGETTAWDRRLLLALRNAADPAMQCLSSTSSMESRAPSAEAGFAGRERRQASASYAT